jgi:hypothetical protein
LPDGLQGRGVCGFGGGVLSRAATHELHKLLMEQRRLSAELLIDLGVRAEQRCNAHRDLIGTRGQHT